MTQIDGSPQRIGGLGPFVLLVTIVLVVIMAVRASGDDGPADDSILTRAEIQHMVLGKEEGVARHLLREAGFDPRFDTAPMGGETSSEIPQFVVTLRPDLAEYAPETEFTAYTQTKAANDYLLTHRQVPRMTLWTQRHMEAVLGGSGINVERVRGRTDQKEDIVIEQEPAAGTPLTAMTEIKMVVAEPIEPMPDYSGGGGTGSLPSGDGNINAPNLGRAARRGIKKLF